MKRMTISIKKIILLLFTLYAFWCNKPYFSWETYRNGAFYSLFGIPIATLFGFLAVLFSMLYIVRYKVNRMNFRFSIAILFASFFLVMVAGGLKHAMSMEWLIYLVPVMYLMYSDEDKIITYDIYLWLFAITLILPIAYYCLSHIGIRIPYTELQSYEAVKIANNNFYKLYPVLGTQFTHRYSPFVAELRLSGIYDEAGRLGTLAGLFLVSERFQIKKNWKNTVIFVGGVLSFSLAFYLIAIVYFLGISIKYKKTKNIALISSIIVAYLVFISFDYANPALSLFKSRVLITSSGLSGDNRTSDAFNAIFNTIYTGNVKGLLFGYGYGALGDLRRQVMADGSSYKTLIYDFGFLGFIFQIVWLIAYVRNESKSISTENRWYCYIILAVYILNMYQRPSMFNMFFLVIFVGGILKVKNEDRYNKNENAKVTD